MSPEQIAEAEAFLADPDGEDCERFTSRYGRSLIEIAKAHWKTRAEGPVPVSAPLDREGVARIIDPDGWATFDRQRRELTTMGRDPESERGPWMYVQRSLAKADAILALSQQDQVGLTTPAVLGEPSADVLRSGGAEFLEFKEALSDLRRLRHEHDCLNGGGPGWTARNAAAWARADELFANDDEAAYDRQQEDAHG